MTALAAALQEILGLFVDDAGLALGILGVVAAALVLAFGLRAPAPVTGAALALGSVVALAASVWRGR
ncbi:MAG: hypothetical protein ABSG83_02115 [Roseiarcus sp.]